MARGNIISKIESTLPFLSTTEQKLAKYILENPKKILSMSTKELASHSGVSEATLIRFTRKLDIDGYSNFKLNLSADLAPSPTSTIPINMNPNDTPIEIYKKLATFTITSIEATGETLVQKDIEKAVNLIYTTYHNNRRIYLSGIGASSTLARELQIKLMRLNIPVIYYEDTHLQLESNLNMQKNDLFICFTTLGKSIQSHQFIDIANEKKANIILITQYGNHKLADKADVTLFTSSVENNLRLASQTAIIVQSMIIDTLFLALALRDLDKIESDVNDTKKVFEKLGYYSN